MTDKPTPTDAELNTILCAHWPAFAAQSTLVKIWVRDAVQDAIDKWGQPAQAAEPVAWYEGNPPFPQDQEWFIAETIYGDKAVLRSLDEGREHKGNYAFKTADETYMKAEIIKRWMQFPDCEYLPPTAPQPVALVPLTDEQTKALMQAHRTAMYMTCKARVPECGEFAAIAQDLDWLCESFGIKGGQHGTE